MLVDSGTGSLLTVDDAANLHCCSVMSCDYLTDTLLSSTLQHNAETPYKRLHCIVLLKCPTYPVPSVIATRW